MAIVWHYRTYASHMRGMLTVSRRHSKFIAYRYPAFRKYVILQLEHRNLFRSGIRSQKGCFTWWNPNLYSVSQTNIATLTISFPCGKPANSPETVGAKVGASSAHDWRTLMIGGRCLPGSVKKMAARNLTFILEAQ